MGISHHVLFSLRVSYPGIWYPPQDMLFLSRKDRPEGQNPSDSSRHDIALTKPVLMLLGKNAGEPESGVWA
jgi:hypothetical protein